RSPGVPGDKGWPADAGVLLASGDFVEGQLKALRDGTGQVTSVLFGLPRFNLFGEVSAVTLRNTKPAPAGYELELRDGSSLLADRIRVKATDLLVENPIVGEIKVPWADLRQLRLGRGRHTALSELKRTAS